MIGSQLGKVTGAEVDGTRCWAAGVARHRLGGLTSDADARRRAAAGPLRRLPAVPRWPVISSPFGLRGRLALFSLQDLGIAVVGQAAASPQAPALPLLGLDDWIALLFPRRASRWSATRTTCSPPLVRRPQGPGRRRQHRARGAGSRRRAGRADPRVPGRTAAAAPPSGTRKAAGRSSTRWSPWWSSCSSSRSVRRCSPLPDRGAGRRGDLRRAAVIDVGEFRRIARSVERAGHRARHHLAWSSLGCSTARSPPSPSRSSTAHRLARPHDAVLGLVPRVAGMHDLDRLPGRAGRSPAWSSTATTRRCASRTPRTSAARPRRGRRSGPEPGRWLVLNAEANVELDVTAAEACRR